MDTQLPKDATVVLYDGVCALGNGVVKFLLAHPTASHFYFAALQSELGRTMVTERGGDPDVVSTLWLIERPGTEEEKCWRRGRAGIRALTAAGGLWRLVGVLRLLPTFVLDAGYRLIAALRFRLAPKLDACPIPAPEHRHRFLA